MPNNAKKFRELLRKTKAEYQQRVDSIHDHARKPLNPDSGEQAAQIGNLEVTSALENEAIQELVDIDEALHRLDAGTFGLCVSCGEAISTERLAVRPASAECLDCAELSR